MSDTPETDAELHRIKVFCRDDYMLDTMADFARELERERDEARDQLSVIHQWIKHNHYDESIEEQNYYQNLERR